MSAAAFPAGLDRRGERMLADEYETPGWLAVELERFDARHAVALAEVEDRPQIAAGMARAA